MNIVISLNDKYVEAAMIMLTTLFEQHCDEKHNIYILYNQLNLKNENILILLSYIKQYNNDCNFISIDKTQFEKFNLGYQFTVEVYFRLLIQTVLPNSIKKILYLDCDMFILKNISEFYNNDFNESICVCNSIDSNDIKNTKKIFNFNDNDIYFNSGVILYNLEKIRKNYSQNYFFEIEQLYHNNIKWVDQDILNIVFKNDKKVFEKEKYNNQIFMHKYLNDIDIKNILNDTYILHYIGDKKPWNSDYDGLIKQLYNKYLNKLK